MLRKNQGKGGLSETLFTNPCHAYKMVLLSAILQLDATMERQKVSSIWENDMSVQGYL